MSILSRILTPKQLKAITVQEYDQAWLATAQPHQEKLVLGKAEICPVCGGERTFRIFLKGSKICESTNACLEVLLKDAQT